MTGARQTQTKTIRRAWPHGGLFAIGRKFTNRTWAYFPNKLHDFIKTRKCDTITLRYKTVKLRCRTELWLSATFRGEIWDFGEAASVSLTSFTLYSYFNLRSLFYVTNQIAWHFANVTVSCTAKAFVLSETSDMSYDIWLVGPISFIFHWRFPCWNTEKNQLLITDQKEMDSGAMVGWKLFAEWKEGLTERPILGLKNMTTSTSLTTDDMWCISCGRSKEVLWSSADLISCCIETTKKWQQSREHQCSYKATDQECICLKCFLLFPTMTVVCEPST